SGASTSHVRASLPKGGVFPSHVGEQYSRDPSEALRDWQKKTTAHHASHATHALLPAPAPAPGKRSRSRGNRMCAKESGEWPGPAPPADPAKNPPVPTAASSAPAPAPARSSAPAPAPGPVRTAPPKTAAPAKAPPVAQTAPVAAKAPAPAPAPAVVAPSVHKAPTARATAPTLPARFVVVLFVDAQNNAKIGLGRLCAPTPQETREGVLTFVKLPLTQASPRLDLFACVFALPTADLRPQKLPRDSVLVHDAQLDSVGALGKRLSAATQEQLLSLIATEPGLHDLHLSMA
ncbi:hypothetical protein B484DRAFT_249812, partial [Ochromonadaceae sp. CCMP2298]